MRKRLWKIAGSILLLPFLLIALLLCERLRGQISLARYRRALIAKGEKLEPRDWAHQPSQGENGAPEILVTSKELNAGMVLPTNSPPRMKLTPAGRAIVCFREDEWVDETVTNPWEQISADLKTNQAALGRIRTALQKPILDNKLDYSQGPKLSIPHLRVAKDLTRWFGGGAQLALHEGRNNEALSDLLADIALARLPCNDGIVISELMRTSLAAIARMDTWEALQADAWEDRDLAAIQHAWENQSFAATIVRGMEGELIYGGGFFDLCRSSNAEAIQMLYGLEEYFPIEDSNRSFWERTLKKLPGGARVTDLLKKQVYCRLWRFAWLDQSERRYLAYVEGLLSIVRLAAINKSFATVKTATMRIDEEFSNRPFYDRLRYPSQHSPLTLSSVVSKGMHAETERSLTICAVALKRFALHHPAPPASLDSLIPEFLSAVPIDYMDGKPIKYHLNSHKTFVLYSVGDDGTDDGGDPTLPRGKTNPRIIWDRKDFVWPAPALPEEVEVYRKEALK